MFLVTNDKDVYISTDSSREDKLKEEFHAVYPFTTENIAGYMEDLDLSNKKIITVTSSSDHIINAIAREHQILLLLILILLLSIIWI